MSSQFKRQYLQNGRHCLYILRDTSRRIPPTVSTILGDSSRRIPPKGWSGAMDGDDIHCSTVCEGWHGPSHSCKKGEPLSLAQLSVILHTIVVYRRKEEATRERRRKRCGVTTGRGCDGAWRDSRPCPGAQEEEERARPRLASGEAANFDAAWQAMYHTILL